MNKSKLFVGALIGTMAFTATLSSCVKDDESESVTAVRSAKASLLNAEAEAATVNAAAKKTLLEAQAAQANAEAELAKAKAAVEEAEAAARNAQTEYEKKNYEIQLQEAQSNLEATQAQNQATIAYNAYLVKNDEYLLAQAIETLRKYNDDLAASQLEETQTKITIALNNYTNALSSLSTLRTSLVNANLSLANVTTDLEDWNTYKAEQLALAQQNIDNKQAALTEVQSWKDMSKEALASELNTLSATKATAYTAYKQASETYTKAGQVVTDLENKEYSTDVNVALARIYATNQLNNSGWTHSIKPYVKWDYVYADNGKQLKAYHNYFIMKNDYVKWDTAWTSTAVKKSAKAIELSTDKKSIKSGNEAIYYAEKCLAQYKEDVRWTKELYDAYVIIAGNTNAEADCRTRDELKVSWENYQTILTQMQNEYKLQKAYVDQVYDTSNAAEKEFNDWVTEYTAAVKAANEAELAQAKALTAYDLASENYSNLYNIQYVRQPYESALTSAEEALTEAKKAYQTTENTVTSKETAVKNAQDTVTSLTEKITAQEKIVENYKAALDALLK